MLHEVLVLVALFAFRVSGWGQTEHISFCRGNSVVLRDELESVLSLCKYTTKKRKSQANVLCLGGNVRKKEKFEQS